MHVSVEHFLPDFPFDTGSNNNNDNCDDQKETTADPEGVEESPANIVLGGFVVAAGIISTVRVVVTAAVGDVALALIGIVGVVVAAGVRICAVHKKDHD